MMTISSIFNFEPLQVEDAPGAEQINMFFDFSNWSEANLCVYVGCLLMAILVTGMTNIWLKMQKGVIKTSSINTYKIITLVLVVLLTALINPSIPVARAQGGEVDPYFIFICILSVLVSTKCFCQALHHLQRFQSTKTNTLEKKICWRKMLIWAGLTGWTLAFLCFFIGMYDGGTQKSLLASLIRPSLMASKMFVLADSFGEIGSTFKQNGLFIGFYSFIKVYVLTVTSFTFISLIWYRISVFWNVKSASGRGKTLYVFYGQSNAHLLLAQDIVSNTTKSEYLVLFVDSADAPNDHDHSNFLSVTGFLNLFSLHRPSFRIANHIDSLLITSNVELDKTFVNSVYPGILEDMELKQLKRLSSEASKVYMFFLGDDERSNIKGALNIKSIMEEELPNSNIQIVALSHEYPDVAIQQITIIDTSLLATQMLFGNSKNHPVNYVDLDTETASVKSRFESIIIGLGSTGQEMVKYLYEFGAFVDHRCSAANSQITFRSEFRCDIMDAHMDKIKESLFLNYPSMCNAQNLSNQGQSNHNDPMLVFHQLTPDDGGFTKLLTEKANLLNYVVITLDDDKQNIEVLNKLMTILIKVRGRKMLDYLHIVVRNYSEPYNSSMVRLADYYNQIYANGQELVTVFGGQKELFTKDIIINERMKQCARLFYQEYCAATNNANALLWDDRHNKAYDYKVTTFEQYYKVKRQEKQEIQNYLHIDTKMRLLGINSSDYGLKKEEIGQLLNIIEKEAHTMTTNASSLPLLNLAKTEHLRWQASLEAMGYVTATDDNQTWCDEMAKTNNCLVPWEILPQKAEAFNRQNPDMPLDYQYLDMMVVKTSLMIVISPDT